jgi:hypothetical protein
MDPPFPGRLSVDRGTLCASARSSGHEVVNMMLCGQLRYEERLGDLAIGEPVRINSNTSRSRLTAGGPGGEPGRFAGGTSTQRDVA